MHKVEIFLTQSKVKSLAGFWCISDRVLLVRLRGKAFDTVVIQCYALTFDCTTEEIDEIYGQLDEVLQQCKSHDEKDIMGDFNAKVGQNNNGGAVGSICLGQRNEGGGGLIEWCKENGLIVKNTFFKHHSRNIYTWKALGDGCRNQIDFSLINERFRNAAQRVSAYPGAHCDTDHILLSAKIRLKLKKTYQKKTVPRLQSKLLKSENYVKTGFLPECHG